MAFTEWTRFLNAPRAFQYPRNLPLVYPVVRALFHRKTFPPPSRVNIVHAFDTVNASYEISEDNPARRFTRSFVPPLALSLFLSLSLSLFLSGNILSRTNRAPRF